MIRAAPFTLAAAAEIAVVALPARPNALVVLAIALLLALTLAMSETVESGRWRVGYRQVMRAHSGGICFGVAGCATALLVSRVGKAPEPIAVTAAIIAIPAMAGLMAVVTVRMRR